MTNQAYYDKIKRFVFSETGLTYYRDKDKELRRKIDRAVKRSNASGYPHYFAMLSSSPDHIRQREFDALVSDLTVGETHFFRDRALFRGIQEVVLPEVIKKNKHKKRLWIWSAGCATGEEVYSISILINRHFPQIVKDWDLRIIGTDINQTFLGKAIQGNYTDWSFRGTPDEIRTDCFDRSGITWTLQPRYRQKVTFQYHNLVSMPFPSVFHGLFSFDIIFCRNVMIYFDASSIKNLISQFQASLVPDGWLVVGHADHNFRYFKSFETLMLPGTSFYKNTVNNFSAPFDRGNQSWEVPDAAPVTFPWKHRTKVFNASPSTLYPHNKAVPDDPAIKQKTAAPASPEARVGLDLKKPLPDMTTLAELINCGDWDNASMLCDTLLKEQQLDAGLYLLSAFIQEQKGAVMDALTCLKKALYLDRKFVIGHYHLGLLHQTLGELKKAEKDFINVINLLNGVDENLTYEMADNISAGQLKSLAQFHLAALKG